MTASRWVLAVALFALLGTTTVNAQPPPVCECPYQGDLNADAASDILDLNLLIDYAFADGSAPVQDPDCPHHRGDINCDNATNLIDVVRLASYIFFNGAPPCDPCSPSNSSCVSDTCDSFVPGCNGSDLCYCWEIYEGGSVCALDFVCSEVQRCFGGTNDCPPGYICVVKSCCVDPVCIPDSSFCPPGLDRRISPFPEAPTSLTGSGRGRN